MTLDDLLENEYLQQAATGFGGGILTGTALGLLSPAKSLKDVLKTAGLTAGIAGLAIPSSYAIGKAILGDKEAGEDSPVAKRAALGAGILGLGAGGLVAAKPSLLKVLPEESYLRTMLDKASKKNRLLLALLAPLSLGAGAAAYGWDEGTGIDALQ